MAADRAKGGLWSEQDECLAATQAGAHGPSARVSREQVGGAAWPLVEKGKLGRRQRKRKTEGVAVGKYNCYPRVVGRWHEAREVEAFVGQGTLWVEGVNPTLPPLP